MSNLLDNASLELKDRLRSIGRERTFPENAQIFAHGAAAAELPIVLAGRVKMIHFLEPGKEVIIGVFGPGEMFAVPPVVDGGAYPATAIAMESSDLLLIQRDVFLDLIRESTELAFAVIQWMCEMLREKTATIHYLATASPEKRLAAVLMKLAEKESDQTPVKISLRRQDIAQMAGLTTETTIRAVRRLAKSSIVAIVQGKIIIEDVDRLRRHAEG